MTQPSCEPRGPPKLANMKLTPSTAPLLAMPGVVMVRSMSSVRRAQQNGPSSADLLYIEQVQYDANVSPLSQSFENCTRGLTLCANVAFNISITAHQTAALRALLLPPDKRLNARVSS